MELGPKTLDFVFYCLKEVTENLVPYLKAATEELKMRTALMAIDYAEIEAKRAKEQEERTKQEQGQGMMRVPFGYCPKCGVKGESRSKKTQSDRCENGHCYPSNTAILCFDKEP